jgi:NADH:ubiquinone oxidoreductase subunit 5 (subunit L)/multisubunit Na+/H+ antiporter MnhA subunit
MWLVIVFLTLIGSIFSGLFGRYVGRIGSVFISILCMIVTTIIALYEFYRFCLAKNCFFILLGS